LLAAAVTLTLAAGCSSSTDDTTMAALGPVSGLETTNMTVAAVPTTDSTGLYVAEYEHLFDKEGLHVTIAPAISAETSVNQLAYNQIQVLAGNYVSFIEAQQNYDNGVKAPKPSTDPNAPPPPASLIAANLDLFAEASVEQAGFVGLFTLPDSPIKNLSQLKGKTIGINAPDNVAYLLTASYLKDNNILPNSVHFASVPFPEMLTALQKHKIDVAFLAEPFIAIFEENAGVIQLTNLDAGQAAALPIEGYATTKGFAKANPNTMMAFEKALQQGQEIAATDRGIAEAATVKYGLLPTMPKGTPAQAAAQIATLLQFETYPLSPVDATRLTRVAEIMQAFSGADGHRLLQAFSVKTMLGT
jgi:NitT/TauT family transport system substrate-binding protein